MESGTSKLPLSFFGEKMHTKKSDKHLFWGIGNMGEGFISMVSSTYFSFFLTDVALLPIGLMSAVSVFTSIFDFMMVPVAGAVISSCKAMKWGRYRSWLLFCPAIATLSYFICFTVVKDNIALTTAFIIVGFCMAKASWNINYAANASLTAVLADNEQMRSKLASQRMIGSNAGRLCGNYLTPIIVAWAAASSGSQDFGYKLTILITGAVYILTNLVHFADSKTDETKPSATPSRKGLSAKETFKVITENPQLFVTLLIDLTSNVASLVLPSLAVYYYKYCAQNTSLTSIHMLIIGFGGITGAFTVRLVGNKIKDSKKWLLCLYVLVALFLTGIRFVAHNPRMFMVFSAFIAIFTGMTSPFELNLYIDNTIYYRYTKRKDATGFIMGLSNLPVKFASIIKSTIIPLTLIIAGYTANAEPTPEMQNAIINAYTTLPCIFPVLGFFLLKFAYKLKKEDIERMKAELETEQI